MTNTDACIACRDDTHGCRNQAIVLESVSSTPIQPFTIGKSAVNGQSADLIFLHWPMDGSLRLSLPGAEAVTAARHRSSAKSTRTMDALADSVGYANITDPVKWLSFQRRTLRVSACAPDNKEGMIRMQSILLRPDQPSHCRTARQVARRKRCAMDRILPNRCLTNDTFVIHFIVFHMVIRVLGSRRIRCWMLSRGAP
jgi:hypothetical protein